jgi:hypothetical protein
LRLVAEDGRGIRPQERPGSYLLGALRTGKVMLFELFTLIGGKLTQQISFCRLGSLSLLMLHDICLYQMVMLATTSFHAIKQNIAPGVRSVANRASRS